MDGKKVRGLKLGLAVAGGLAAILVVLLVLGLTVGRRDESRNAAERIRDHVAQPDPAGQQPLEEPSPAGGLETHKESSEGATVTVKPGPEGDTVESGTGKQTGVPTTPGLDAKTIKTATMAVEIDEGSFDTAYQRVTQVAEQSGGYVSDSRSSSDGGRIVGGTITVRVPADSFNEAMNEFKELGEVTALEEQSQDVSEEYVDLESRIRNLEAQEAVYLSLMARAQTIEESIAVQRELTAVQEEIERLKGRKNYLDNHVQFSTIQVSLLEPGAGAPVDGGEGWGFLGALEDGLHGIVDGINVVVRAIGYSLVYVLLIALVAATVFYLVRRRPGNRPGREAA